MVLKKLSAPIRRAMVAGVVALCLAGGAALALASHGAAHRAVNAAGTASGLGPAPAPGSPAPLGDASDAQPTPSSSAPDRPAPSPAGAVPANASTPIASPRVSGLATTRAPAVPSPTLPGAIAAASGQGSGSSPAPTGPASASGCPANQQLTDAEINWLLGEVSGTAGTDPQYAAGKATIDAGLQPLLGQNLCANQAQPTVNALCADPSASSLIAAMTKKMPIYVRAYVGNPCSAQLSTVLPKLAPFTAALG